MRASGRRRHPLAAVLVTLMLAALSGCGADEDPDLSSLTAPGDLAPEDNTGAPAEAGDPAEGGGGYTLKTLLPAMQEAFVEYRSAHMELDIDAAGQSISAEGDVAFDRQSPMMRMTMEAAAFGGSTLEMRVVRGVVYMSMPPMTPEGKFFRIDPNAPGDPFAGGMDDMTEQMDPQSTFDAFEAGLRHVRYVGEELVSGEDMDHYVLRVYAAAAFKAKGQPVPSGMPKTIEYDMWLDGDDLMRKLTWEYVAGSSAVTTISDWGEPVTVKAPRAKDIVKMPAR